MPPSAKVEAILDPSTSPEFTALILAGTPGSRLFPLTTSSSFSGSPSSSSYKPKHLLPIVGIPVILRLLHTLVLSGFEECVLTVSSDDQKITYNTILEDMAGAVSIGDESDRVIQISGSMNVKVLNLPMESCHGSADALRHSIPFICPSSNVMVLPGDLVLEGKGVLGLLADVHRRKSDEGVVGCTILLSDVGEDDENGAPLKESAKIKKGGFGREEEDMEYICLSHGSKEVRVIQKESKIDVEEDSAEVGSTPKLHIPKVSLLSCKSVSVRTDLMDLHVYVLSPLIVKLVAMRGTHFIGNLQNELIPFLLARQWRTEGIECLFGKDAQKEDFQQLLDSLASPVRPPTCLNSSFGVYAFVIPRGPRLALRTSNIPSYLYANRGLLSHNLHPPECPLSDAKNHNPGPYASTFIIPPDSTPFPKTYSIVLSNTQIADKVTVKSSIVGSNSQIGNKTKLNNVVVMDDVTIGTNCTLQNSVLGKGARIGDNVSLNDVQVGTGGEVLNGVKLKGESVVKEEAS